MNKSAIKKVLLILWAGCLIALAWNPLYAQSGQLLTNPGFEDPYVTVDGDPPRQVAQGWTPWHVPAAPGSPTFANLQPEYEPTAPDTTRILEGNNAQLIRSFFATHDGGVYQRVQGVTSGTKLRFSVNAYVWSTTYDAVNLSEEDGNVFVQVGIDPTGGTDGQSSKIIWSPAGVEKYDAYNEYSVEATAQGSAVTVFVRTTVGVPVKNSYIYLDKASLTAVSAAAPTATYTLKPPTATNTSAPPTATNTSAPPTATFTQAPILPSDTPTIDSIPLTATAIVAQATQTAIAGETATALVPPTATPNQQALTATAIIAAATATGSAAQTATALVPTTSPTPSNTPTATITPLPTNTKVPLSELFPGTVMHTVQRGDAVVKLAAQYDSSVEAIVEANGLDPNTYLIRVGQNLIIPVRQPVAPTVAPTNTPSSVVVVTATPSGPVPPIGASGIYTVQPGDSLLRIARLFDTTIETIAQLNGIVNLDRIQVGQQLNLPAQPTPQPPARPSQTYQVRPGDTLFRISLRFGVSVAQIAQANNIINLNRIYAGQVLIIP